MDSVVRHYGLKSLEEKILAALADAGKDPENLTLADLAPVDEFHIRGKEATEELAGLAELGPDRTVLDVGSGLGGSCRYLAATFGCRTTGIDLTPEYVELSERLSSRVGQTEVIDFRVGSALDMPFDDDSFDVVWTEHAQMNIEDKGRFYSEIHRVLRDGGRLVFHDIFAGEGGDLRFPVPWAGRPEINFLLPSAELRDVLESRGFRVRHWADKTEPSLDWFRAALERARSGGPPAVGIHLLMGDDAPEKLRNMAKNLEEQRLVVLQAALTKAPAG